MGLVDRGRLPGAISKLMNLGRSYSLWVYQWGLACCAIEMGAAFPRRATTSCASA